jgi:hypothetical protein
MLGYAVVTSDEKKIGDVVATHGEYLVVEQGTLFKSRHALPRAFAHVDDVRHTVCVTVPAEMLHDSPKVSGDELDEEAIAQFYGLADAVEQPATAGYGETLASDPAYGPDRDREAAALEPVERERAEIRRGVEDHNLADDSPALLGDRTASFEDRD